MPAPDIMVTGPGGDIRLVVDVVQPRWLFAEMLGRFRAHSERDVASYWIFESARWIGAALTVFRRGSGGGLDPVESTREQFSVSDPFPVAVDLPRLSEWWPQTFEYRGRRDSQSDAE